MLFRSNDTVNGRFDLIVLHLALVLDRLAPEPGLKRLGQRLFDRFCQDMDDNLREMGVGDLKVPKEMRRMGEAFFGRAQAYRAALAAPDQGEALVAAVARNIYGGSSASPAAAASRKLCSAATCCRKARSNRFRSAPAGRAPKPDAARSNRNAR